MVNLLNSIIPKKVSLKEKTYRMHVLIIWSQNPRYCDCENLIILKLSKNFLSSMSSRILNKNLPHYKKFNILVGSITQGHFLTRIYVVITRGIFCFCFRSLHCENLIILKLSKNFLSRIASTIESLCSNNARSCIN
jgi:Ran GTPase-activating protein (RanGAP) involved in mRNA processing and transport